MLLNWTPQAGSNCHDGCDHATNAAPRPGEAGSAELQSTNILHAFCFTVHCLQVAGFLLHVVRMPA